MTAAQAPRPVSVTGGTAGIAANCAEITAMAQRFGSVGAESGHAALALHGYLAHPAVVTSAVLDPGGFARFEAELEWALDGFQGLSWAAAECAAVDGELRAAAAAYRAADRLATDLRDEVRGLVGLGPALVDGGRALVTTGDPLRAAGAVVARDPELADVAVDALGLPTVITALAETLPDGHGVVRRPGVDADGVAGRPPRDLVDVLRDLARRCSDRSGEIDVRILTRPDGSRRAIVDISGTKSWTPLPTRDVTSLTTNGRALVGLPTAYEGGVLAAMRRAGVRPSDEVMLVGHSQGGMVAVTAARDAVRSGEFNVTHVVTAGSPIGRTVGDLPGRVQVLAMEGTRDVVPHLDGVANPDRPNVTTAKSARGNGTIIGDHATADVYVRTAGDVQASADPSLRDFLASADGYFDATKVVTHTYQIQRAY